MTDFWTHVERWRDAGRALVPATPQGGLWTLPELDVSMRGTGPVAGLGERETGRLGCVIYLAADRGGRGLGEVVKAAGTVLITDRRLILAVKSGATAVGEADPSRVVVASLPWSIVDEITLPVRTGLGDRVAGGRMVTLTNYSTCIFRLQLLARARLSEPPDEQPNGRATAQQLFDESVHAAARWRISATRSADEKLRLRELIEGHCALEDGLRTALLLEVVDDQPVLPPPDGAQAPDIGHVHQQGHDPMLAVAAAERVPPNDDEQDQAAGATRSAADRLADRRNERAASADAPSTAAPQVDAAAVRTDGAATSRRPQATVAATALVLVVAAVAGFFAWTGGSGQTDTASAPGAQTRPDAGDNGTPSDGSLSLHPVLGAGDPSRRSTAALDVTIANVVFDDTGQTIEIGPAALTGSDVEQARAEKGGQAGSVSIVFLREGTRKWQALTALAACSPPGDPRRRVAFVVDGEVVSSPQVDPTVECNVGIEGGSTTISGNFTPEEADDLARRISGT